MGSSTNLDAPSVHVIIGTPVASNIFPSWAGGMFLPFLLSSPALPSQAQLPAPGGEAGGRKVDRVVLSCWAGAYSHSSLWGFFMGLWGPPPWVLLRSTLTGNRGIGQSSLQLSPPAHLGPGDPLFCPGYQAACCKSNSRRSALPLLACLGFVLTHKAHCAIPLQRSLSL